MPDADPITNLAKRLALGHVASPNGLHRPPAQDAYTGDHTQQPLPAVVPAEPEHGDAYEPPPEGSQPTTGASQPPLRRFGFNVLDSAAFAAARYERKWLIDRVLVKDQPTIAGGPRKALKTSMLLVDLAVSLGTATPFLGSFRVFNPVRTAVLSGESGEATLQDTARRVCEARGVELAEAGVLWGFQLPQLSNILDLDVLRRGLEAHKVEVSVIDPLYLCLLAGQTENRLQAGNLFDMGPLLYGVAQACLSVGCTPILLHHSVKRLTHSFEPLELEDLAFAGVQEFARQWMLINRREAFDPETGSHRLWLSVGGSAGHAGLYAVDVDEGVLGADFSGRKWEVTVRTGRQAREATAGMRDVEKELRKAQQLKEDGTALLTALDHLADASGTAGYTKVRDTACLPNPRMVRAVFDLVQGGILEEVDIVSHCGTNNRVQRPAKGLRRQPRRD